MLSVNEMSRITMELVLDMPPSDTSPEAEDFRRKQLSFVSSMLHRFYSPWSPMFHHRIENDHSLAHAGGQRHLFGFAGSAGSR